MLPEALAAVICLLYSAMLAVSLFTCPAMVSSWELIVAFCWVSCVLTALKRLLRVCAWVSSN
ncbi:hypothetical protein D3C76_1230530 [compost metagenome]